ncbi:MAG: hypothetical protein ACFE9L_06665 [Candidatus Hodarchaeota archaeon]
MVRITYPQALKCPHCKSVIRLDYSDKTDDLLVLNKKVSWSQKPAKDMRSNKQNIGPTSPHFVICQSFQTILGTYNWAMGG